MRAQNGRAVLSINDHPDMRAAFAGLHAESVDINYSVNSNDGHGAGRRELVEFSWARRPEEGGLF